MFQQAQAANRPDESGISENIEGLGDAQIQPPSMGELLYPGFNQVVPYVVEVVVPNLCSVSSKDAQVMIESFYQVLEFAFRTQVFEK